MVEWPDLLNSPVSLVRPDQPEALDRTIEIKKSNSISVTNQRTPATVREK